MCIRDRPQIAYPVIEKNNYLYCVKLKMIMCVDALNCYEYVFFYSACG